MNNKPVTSDERRVTKDERAATLYTPARLLEMALMPESEVRSLSVVDDYLHSFSAEQQGAAVERWRANKLSLRALVRVGRRHFREERRHAKENAKIQPLLKIIIAREALLSNPADFEAAKKLASAQKEFERAMIQALGIGRGGWCEAVLTEVYGLKAKKAKGGAKVS